MVNIVTGYIGKPHVQAAEQGLFNAGVCGEKVVLPTNEQFKFTLNSNNSISIASGDLVNQGRHITIPFNSSEDLTIENGKAGYNRIDTIVMRYEKNIETSVESAKLMIIKGTASTTTAEPPSITSGNIFGGALIDDMPLYNIHIQDLNVTEVETVFQLTDSLSFLSDENTKNKNNIATMQNVITAFLSANYTIQKSNTVESLTLSSAINNGDAFKIENGKIKIVGDISKVIVSANIHFSPQSSGGKALRVFKNTQLVGFYYINHGNMYDFSMGISPKIIEVQKGDEIFFAVNGTAKDNIDSAKSDTFLTVQAVC